MNAACLSCDEMILELIFDKIDRKSNLPSLIISKAILFDRTQTARATFSAYNFHHQRHP